MVKSNLSMKQAAIEKRIQRLARVYSDRVEAYAKGQAEELVKRYHDGIKADEFGLAPLQPATVSQKDAAGYELPESPLYGLGDEAEDTYANALEAVRQDKRYVVRPRDARHQYVDKDGRVRRSKITLKGLFMVHEYGCTITNGFGRGITIRLPPRPALHYAYRALMDKRRRLEPAAKVRTAMARYVREGDEAMIKEIQGRLA